MDWTDQELDELASFFSKRMTVELVALDPADPPPPGDPSRAWRTRLRTARDRNELPRLARKIASVLPADANLQQATALLSHSPVRRTGAVRVLGAAVMVGVAAGVVLAGSLVGVGVAAYGLPRVARVEAPPAADAPVLAVAEAPVEAPAAPASAPEVPHVDEAPSVEVVSARAIDPPQNPLARCGGTAGELVGYWYAGERRPGKEGDRIVLDRTVNVRADYPDVHNGFQKRSEVRCVLVAGDKVRLAKGPVQVPGDAYWVPLVAGTVTPVKNG